jgi:hypothetical protein
MVFLSLFGVVFLSLATVRAAPLNERASIASDAVVGFPQTVPSGTAGKVYLAYQPHLDVVNGCVPFPAVDASGNTKCVDRLQALVLTSYRSQRGPEPHRPHQR